MVELVWVMIVSWGIRLTVDKGDVCRSDGVVLIPFVHEDKVVDARRRNDCPHSYAG